MKGFYGYLVGVVLASSVCLGLAYSTAGCPAAVPGVSCVAVVLSDALKGMTLSQILADAGPTCVTSISEIITILLGSDDPRIQACPAYNEAKAQRGDK